MNNLITPQNDYATLCRQAKHLVESGFLPEKLNTPQKVVAVASLGLELGLKTWQSINGIHVINGKPSVSPQLMLGLIEASGKLEDMKIDSKETECVVTMKRVGRSTHTAIFTLEHARKMGLVGKDNWKKQPDIMLQWRAVAKCARAIFSDVIQGLYLHEELNPDVVVDEEGEIIDAESKQVISQEKPVALPAPAPEKEEKTPEPAPKSEEPELVIPSNAITKPQWGKPWMALKAKGYSQDQVEAILRPLYERFSMPDGSKKTSTKQLTEKELGFVMSALAQYPQNVDQKAQEPQKLGDVMKEQPNPKNEIDRIVKRLGRANDSTSVSPSDMAVLVTFAESFGQKSLAGEVEEMLGKGFSLMKVEFLSLVEQIQNANAKSN